MTVTLTLSPVVEGAIQEAARRQGQTPEQAITEALQTLFAPRTPDEADQQRRRAAMAQMLTDAHALKPMPRDSDPTHTPEERAPEEAAVEEIILDKFRRQGFHL